MKELVVARYLGFDKFMHDLARLDDVIDDWKVEYPDYEVKIVAEIGADEVYSITVLCKRPYKE